MESPDQELKTIKLKPVEFTGAGIACILFNKKVPNVNMNPQEPNSVLRNHRMKENVS